MLIRNNDVIARKVCDSIYLIDTTDNYAADSCSLYEINDIGWFVWEKLSVPTTIGGISQDLIAQIESPVTYEEIEHDVSVYVQLLIEEGFVFDN